VQSIREAADAGRPAVLQQNTPQAIAFTELAQKVAQKIAVSYATQLQTEEVKN
jgi:ATP-binding protein involved in chromosome partitioning